MEAGLRRTLPNSDMPEQDGDEDDALPPAKRVRRADDDDDSVRVLKTLFSFTVQS